MGLIADYTREQPDRQTMTREGLIGLIRSDAKFMDDREDIAAYIDTLQVGAGLDERVIRAGYEVFKAEKSGRELAAIASRHGLEAAALQIFVDGIMRRMIFDGEQLGDLLAPLDLGWKARTKKELALMEDLIPVLHELAQGREISGLKAYE
jgi:type I restriction enzyme R subunit